MKTIKAKNGKSYTKKQICEAIEYWKKQLKKLDENETYYSGGGAGNNDKLKSKLSKPNTITLHGYDRINNKIGEINVNPNVVEFFRELANKNKGNWIIMQVIVDDPGFDEDVNIFYAKSIEDLNKMLEDAAENG